MIDFVKNNKLTILLGILLIILLLIESNGRGDFNIFLNASRDLLEGKNIYSIKYNEWYHYYYDILFALIISPLKALPLFWSNFIWLLLNLFLTFRIWKIILSYLPVSILNHKQLRILTVLSFIFIFSLWHKNIHLSQMTIFILYLCLEGLNQIKSNKLILGSVLIGVGISIKILPIVFIPYFLYRANFKVVFYILLSLILVLWLPALIIGYDYHLLLLKERWMLINPLNKEHVLDVSERSFHSLTTFLTVLLVEGAGNTYSLELKRNITNVSLETLELIINIVRLSLVLFSLYIMRSLPFKKSTDQLQKFYEISYILLVVPLIFPHQQHYAFFFIFPAITYLIFYFIVHYFKGEKTIKQSEKVFIIIISVVIFFLLNSHFILGAFRNIYDHFKTLTYGVLFLVPLLAFASPKKIKHIL